MCSEKQGAGRAATDKHVMDGVEAYSSNNCDAIITLGGGSSHGCGKGWPRHRQRCLQRVRQQVEANLFKQISLRRIRR